MSRKKRGPGRPVSTNSKANPLISFRVSDAQLADLTTAGKKRKPKELTANLEAKRRCFHDPTRST